MADLKLAFYFRPLCFFCLVVAPVLVTFTSLGQSNEQKLLRATAKEEMVQHGRGHGFHPGTFNMTSYNRNHRLEAQYVIRPSP